MNAMFIFPLAKLQRKHRQHSMIRFILFFSLVLILGACDQHNHLSNAFGYDEVKKGITDPLALQKDSTNFSNFLQHLSQNSFASTENELDGIKEYLPNVPLDADMEFYGFQINSNFKDLYFVFFEFTFEETPTNDLYLASFNKYGKILDFLKFNLRSFDSNFTVNMIDEEILEIAYYGFHEEELKEESIKSKVSENVLRISNKSSKSKKKKKKKKKAKVLQEFNQNYLKISEKGIFNFLDKSKKVNIERNYPSLSNQVLSMDQLEDLSIEELQLMRGELYAVHGYIFPDEKFAQYFDKVDWYYPTNKKVDTLFNDVEEINLDKISASEKAKKF